MDFESNLKDPTAPIAIDFDPGRNVLLLAFGGLAGQLGMPMFEFNKLTSGLKQVNKIYLRDIHEVWYHRGLPGIGNDIGGIARLLRQYSAHQSTRRTVVFGNSGGGYAALLFGHLLQADEVHAFSPKTFVDPVKRLLLRDIPAGSQRRTLWWLFRHGQREYFDLRKMLLADPEGRRNVHIHYSANHRIDGFHASRVESLAGVHTHSYQHDQHNLIRQLRESGELSGILARSLQLVN